MRRPVATAHGEGWAQFSIARIAPGVMPEGRVQFLTHHSEELVWREPFLDHPNGARALAALWIAAMDPAEPAARFGRFLGRPISREGEVWTVSLERGAVRAATPEFLERELGVAPGPPLPYLAAYEVEAASPTRLEQHLRSARLDLSPVRHGIVVRLPISVGGSIVFRYTVD
jgi:hypothetical protein